MAEIKKIEDLYEKFFGKRVKKLSKKDFSIVSTGLNGWTLYRNGNPMVESRNGMVRLLEKNKAGEQIADFLQSKEYIRTRRCEVWA